MSARARAIPVLTIVMMAAASMTVAPARAGDERHPLRLELSPAMVVHSDSQTSAAFDARTTGQTFSHLRLEGEVLPWRLPLGLGLRLELERAKLEGSGGGFGDFNLDATAFSIGAGLAGRVSLSRGFDVRGMVGYNLDQLPLLTVASGGRTLEVVPVRAHGPLLALAVRAPLGRRLGFEVRGLAVPSTFGGDLAGTAISTRRLRGGASLLVRSGQGLWRWAVSLGYDLERSTASGTGLEASGWRHIVGLGIELDRVRLAPAPAPVQVQAEAPAQPAAPSFGRVRGFVRAAAAGAVAGLPIADATVQVNGLPPVQSALDGSFAIEGVPAGPAPLTVRAPGWQPLDEVISVPAGGEATIDLALTGGHVQDFATIRGVVRSSSSGAPIAATIAVRGQKDKLTAGADGTFVVLVPPGEHAVRLSAPGFAEQSKTLTVARGEQAILNVDLQPK